LRRFAVVDRDDDIASRAALARVLTRGILPRPITWNAHDLHLQRRSRRPQTLYGRVAARQAGRVGAR